MPLPCAFCLLHNINNIILVMLCWVPHDISNDLLGFNMYFQSNQIIVIFQGGLAVLTTTTISVTTY